MPSLSPSERRSFQIWLATVALGFAYWLGALARSGIAFHGLAELPLAMLIPWKGACTFGLAISIAVAARGRATQYLVIALAISAVADMLLPLRLMIPAGLLFSVSHTIAIAVFWRNRATDMSPVRRAFAIALPFLTFGLSVAALYGTDQPMFFALYPLLSGVMAASAIMSRFPIWWCGLGAVIFICSDVLVLAYLGVFEQDNRLNFLTWLTYFSGYALLARGAVIARFDAR